MEVATRRPEHAGSVNTFVQETKQSNSQFLLGLKYSFQTSSKLYYILQYVGDSTLESLWEKEGPFGEERVRFYACEILVALEELHDNGLKYGKLDLGRLLIDSTGHVIVSRRFCGEKYWTRDECVCNLPGFRRGYPCENSHDRFTEREIRADFQHLGSVLLQLYTKENLSHILPMASVPDDRFTQLVARSYYLPHSLSAIARDLVTRLLKGQFYTVDQVKNHPFFRGVRWHEVKSRRLYPPPEFRKTSVLQNTYTPTASARSYGTAPQGYHEHVRPQGYHEHVRPQGCQEHVRPQGYQEHVRPQGYQEHVRPHPVHSTSSTPDLSICARDDYSHSRPHSFPDYPPASGWSYQPSLPKKHSQSHSLTDLRCIDDDCNSGCRGFGRSRTLPLSELPPHDQMNDLHRRPSDSSDYNFRYHPQDSRAEVGHGLLRDRHHRIDARCVYDRSPEYVDNHEFRDYNQPRLEASSVTSRPARMLLGNRSISFHTDHHMHRREDSQRYFMEIPPSLHRARSCSELDRVEPEPIAYRTNEIISTDINRRSSYADQLQSPRFQRKERPLAHVPIPSFEEFKRRKSEVQNTNELSAQNTEQARKYSNVPTMAPRTENHKYGDRMTSSVSSSDEGRRYVAKSDVIHNLLLKYGLYDRKENGKEITSKWALNNDTGASEEKKGRIRRSGYPSISRDTRDIGGVPSEGVIGSARSPRAPAIRIRINSPPLAYKELIAIPHTNNSNQTKNASHSSKLSNSSKDSSKTTNNAIHSNELAHSSKDSSNTRKNARNANEFLESSNDSINSQKCTGDRSDKKEKNDVTGEPSPGPSTRLPLSHVTDYNNNKVSEKKCSISQNTNTVEREQDAEVMSAFENSPSPDGKVDETRISVSEPGSPYPQRNAKLSAVSDFYRPVTPIKRSPSTSSVNSEGECKSSETERKSSGFNVASKALWSAAKFKLRLGRSPTNSPKLSLKSKEEGVTTTNDIAFDGDSLRNNETFHQNGENVRPRIGKKASWVSMQSHLSADDATKVRRPSADSNVSHGQLRKTGVHTSLLSIASSVYSTDTEHDDSAYGLSDGDAVDAATPRNKRRWDSFHSNVSADSGSAHMFDFDTDSVITEYDEEAVFEDAKSTDDTQARPDVEIERTDSGVGGDLGPDPRPKPQSWEDIVEKSSKRWSVVAVSAKHWQEVARKKKKEKEQNKKHKNVASVITENMVECPNCLKLFVPNNHVVTAKERATSVHICPKCIERRTERKEAIIELVQTEINYGNDLQILKEEFYSPMQSGGILIPEHLAAIFLNLQELVEVNSKFSSRLQHSLEESVAKGDAEFCQVNIGSVFLENVDFFQSYKIYCSKQNAASALLESLQKKNELLKIFLNVTCRENPKCRKMDLTSFLLAPVQRIMKYPLLLSRIRKSTPRGNADREKLMVAQRRIEDQLNRINSLNSAVESKRRYRGSGHLGRSDSLDKLQMKKMASDILHWSMTEMQLLMHGVFEVTIQEFASSAAWSKRNSRSKSLDVFMLFCIRGNVEHVTIDSDDEGLCEDPLFPCETEATDAALVMLRKKINGKYTLYREPLFLDTCVVINNDERKDSFELLKMGLETYIFRASTSRENRRWLKYLRIQAKDLGSWRRRRNGLPNIMIKTI
ncbi:uncharacterized protein LOC5513651 isoform X2 [Nematostella vectensis]|nr:uncharacterized protein LOC5513651 isoform X2 [Nematostella vectensis]